MEGSGLDGRTELVFIVREDGSVGEPSVRMTSHPAFAAAAMEVIPQWRFRPAIRDGRTIPVRVNLPFVFRAGPSRKVNAMLGRVVYEDIYETIFSPAEVGGLPKIIHTPITPYPKSLLGSGWDETVNVTMVVGPDGLGYNMEVEGYPPKDFTLAAIVAASRYRFEPVTYQGKPVYVYTRLSILITEDGLGARRRGQLSEADDPYADYPDS
jgi:TonB family protein